MKILYEDNDIIVCYKEAGVPVQSARIGQQDMVSILNNYLADTLHRGQTEENCVKNVEKSPKKESLRGKPSAKAGGKRSNENPPFPEIYVVHRLDQPVEGVLVFAKTKRAASGLSRQVSDNTMKKTYHAVCCVRTDETEDTVIKKKQVQRKSDLGKEPVILEDYLVKDGRNNCSFVADMSRKDAKCARLQLRILDVHKDTEERAYALAEIQLQTGRHHQIRVQMAHHKMALYGDRKYNGEWEKYVLENTDQEGNGVSGRSKVPLALCAVRLSFRHPVSEKMMTFEAKPQGEIFQIFGSKEV